MTQKCVFEVGFPFNSNNVIKHMKPMPQLIPNVNENLGFTANYPYTLLVKSFKSHTILVYPPTGGIWRMEVGRKAVDILGWVQRHLSGTEL